MAIVGLKPDNVSHPNLLLFFDTVLDILGLLTNHINLGIIL